MAARSSKFLIFNGGIMKLNFAVVCSTLALCGCSTVMEANRPTSVSIKEYKYSDKRFDVVSKLGAPLASEKQDSQSCDLYKLYTHGHSGAAKGAIVAGSAVADVLTLGLFEVVGTSAQAASKSKLHNVMFCYDQDNRLVALKNDGVDVDIRSAAPPPAAPSQSPHS